MKKSLALCALSLLACSLTAEARYWKSGSQVTASAIQPGQWYALQGAWSLVNGNYAFLSGERHTNSYNLTTENLYCFEDSGEVTADGSIIYYLKRYDGEYLYDAAWSRFYGPAVERAWRLTVKDAVSYDKDNVVGDEEGNDLQGMDSYIYEAQQAGTPLDLAAASYIPEGDDYVVIASASADDESDPYSTYTYLCGLGDGVMTGNVSRATNYNTNAWLIVPASEMTAKESLTAKMEEITDGTFEVNLDDYQLGEGAGEYNETLYDEFMKVWERADQLVNGGASATDEEYDKLAESIEPALDAFRNSGKGLTEGYYILYNMRTQEEAFSANNNRWPYVSNGSGYDGGAMYDGGAVTDGDNGLRWSLKTNDGVDLYIDNDGAGHVSVQGGYTYDVAKFVWHAYKSGNKDAQGNDLFYFQNLETDRYIGNVAAQYQPIIMSDEPVTEYTIATNPYIPGWFCFYSPQLPKAQDGSAPSPAEYSGIHTERNNSNVVAWDWRVAGSCWKVITLSDDDVETLRAALEGPKRLAQLTSLVNKAEESIAKGYTYSGYDAEGNKCPEAASGSVELSGLVTSVEQVASEASDSDEGNLEALFDANESTYHHSDWHDNFQGQHYLQFTIEQPEESLLLKWVKRQAANYNNGSPTTFDLYATTDGALLEEVYGDYTDAEGNELSDGNYWQTLWTKVGSGEFSYDYRSASTFNFTDNNVGTAFVKCEGGRYPYFRLVPTGRVTNNNVWFHAAEFRVYRGALDLEASLITAVPEAVVDNLNKALSVARDEVADGEATQATIDALRKAYDEFLASYPDPVRVTDALVEAKTLAETAIEGEGFGYYTEGSISALSQAIDEVESKIKPVMSVEEINNLLAQLDAALTQFNAAFQVPTDGLYVIKSKSSNTKNFGRAICAVNSSTTQNVKTLGTLADGTAEANTEARPGRYWQVEKVDGGYTYKNLYTGMYLAPVNNTERTLALSTTPYVFALQYAKYEGCFNLVIDKKDAVGGQHIYANADPSGVLVTWNSANGNDNSAWSFEAVSADDINGELAWGGIFDLEVSNAPQIMTFTVDMQGTTSAGKFYSVIGQSANKDIQLSLVSDVLKAGQAYVFVPAESGTTAYLEISNPEDITSGRATREAVEHNGLVATFDAVTFTAEDHFGIFNKAHTQVLLTEEDDSVAPNTGYFAVMPVATTTGDLTIKANGIVSSSTADGIRPALIDNRAAEGIYNLAGIRINSSRELPAGLYIMGGKKLIVK